MTTYCTFRMRSISKLTKPIIAPVLEKMRNNLAPGNPQTSRLLDQHSLAIQNLQSVLQACDLCISAADALLIGVTRERETLFLQLCKVVVHCIQLLLHTRTVSGRF